MKCFLKPRKLVLATGLALVSSLSFADDLMLIYQQALNNNPELLQQKAERDKAMASVGISRAELLPQLNANVGYTQSTEKDKGSDTVKRSNVNGTVTLEQSIFNYANWQGFSASKKRAAQAETHYQYELQKFIEKTAELYFAVLTAQDKLEAAKAGKNALLKTLQQQKQKFKVGLIPVADVHTAQAEYDASISQTISAENKLLNQMEVLRAFTGIDHTDLALLDIKRFSTPALQPDHVEDWVSIAEKSSLQLIEARMAREVAEASASQVFAGHLPTLDASGSYSKTAKRKEDGVDQNSSDTTLARVTLAVPLFNGLKTVAATEKADLEYLKQSEGLEKTYREVVRNVRSSFYDVKAAISQFKAKKQALVSKRSSLRASQAGFEVGTRTIVNVLDDTKAVFEAKSAVAESRYNYIKAVLQLKLNAGNLEDNDLEMINRGLVHAIKIPQQSTPSKPAPTEADTSKPSA